MANEEACPEACEKFEEQIKLYEDYLFGFNLYQETAPGWVQRLQEGAYHRTVSRVKDALWRGRSLLADVKSCRAAPERLQEFVWPPWTPEMEYRIKTMLRAYAIAFPSRPKKPLGLEEASALQKAALELL